MSMELPAGVIGVIRCDSAEECETIALGFARGGVDAVEITFTVPDAAQVIAAVRDRVDVPLGGGTVRDLATCAAAAAAGATFVVSPDTDAAVVAEAHRLGMAAVPGALTPNEVAAAIRAGADAIKLFPVEALGGVEHVAALDGPYPGCRWVVSGGVEPDRVAAYRAAGCHAICLGGALWTAAEARAGDVDAIARRTRDVLALSAA